MTTLRRVWRLAVLIVHFTYALVRANLEIAHLVATPGTGHIGVLALELGSRNPWLITTLANLITLTPGTLTLDVAEDRSEIYVHALTTRSLEAVRRDLHALQRRLLEVTR